MTKPSILLSVCLFVLVFISCLMKVKNFEPSNSKKINKNKIKCAQVYGYQDFKIQVCVLSFMIKTCCYENTSTITLNTYALPGDVIGETIPSLLAWLSRRIVHAALYFAIFYMHAIFPLQKTFIFVMRSCVLFLKFFDLFSKTHARFPGFLSRIPLVYNAHQLSFETFNISINISPPDLTAAFISYV